jgi:hypothetical protein
VVAVVTGGEAGAVTADEIVEASGVVSSGRPHAAIAASEIAISCARRGTAIQLVRPAGRVGSMASEPASAAPAPRRRFAPRDRGLAVTCRNGALALHAGSASVEPANRSHGASAARRR